MRKALAKQEGERRKFLAIFSRIGKKSGFKGYSEETILLKTIQDGETGTLVADHLWFSLTKGFQDARLSEGDRVEFEARVKKYRKGYVNAGLGITKKSLDYKLSHPSKIKKVNVSFTISSAPNP